MNNAISNKMYEILRKAANVAVESTLIRIPCEALEPGKVSLEGCEKETPIFIIGPPRSGTTLLYQLLIGQFSFSYINRLMNLFYYSPLLMTKISCLLKYFHKAKMNTNSDYGTTPGILSPDEGRKIWSRLLPEKNGSHYIPQGSCTEQQINEIRRLVLGIKGIANKPFLHKGPSLSLGLAPISEAFPQALYIVVVRDPLYNAQSLYIARLKKKEKVDSKGWWDAKPKEYKRICSDDSLLQSVNQAYYILKQIDEDRGLLDNRMMWLRYEDLCEKPAIILDLISNFMEQNKLKVMVNKGFNMPSISHRNVRKIDVEIFSRLKREVDCIFNGWKPKINKGT